MADKSKGRLRSRWDSYVSINPKVSQSEKPHSVKQEFVKEVNINTIMAKARNGIDPPRWMTSKTPMYGDFSNTPSNFQDAFAQVERATEAFYALPVDFRRELGHDPRNLPKAPRELFERYGLVKSSPQGKGQAAGAPKGEGDPLSGATSPNTGDSRPSKKVSEKPSIKSDED